VKFAASRGTIRIRKPRLVAVILVVAGLVAGPACAASQTSLPSRAQPVGVPLVTIITFGNQYEGGDELYDAKITVLEIVRGNKAWAAIQQAGASNQPPKQGLEYVLARIRFAYSARTRPGERVYSLDPNQFTAINSQGAAYPASILAAAPGPELRAALHSGYSVEGWVAFEVPRTDRSPLMMFQPYTGSVFNEGGASFFKLYPPSAVVPSASPRPR
jgi:hypothetical protein